MLFNKIKNIWYRDKVINTFYIVLFWMLVGHGFIFLNQLVSHDSLMALEPTPAEMKWKIELGRVFVPVYMKFFRGVLASSWLIGILSSINFTVIICLLKYIFKIKRLSTEFFIAGVLIVNLTIISQAATYINELDCNTIALLMSVLAVYLWNKESNKYILLAMLCLMTSLGIYQSYISVVIVLIIMKLMLNIMNGERLDITLKKGVKGIIILIGGGLLYALSMRLIQTYYDIAIYSGGYNSVDKFLTMSVYDYLLQSYYAYASCVFILIDSLKFYSVKFSRIIHIILLILATPVIYFLVRTKKIELKEKILFIFLGLILPLGMNISQVLAKGWSHYLMYYAIWLTYFFVVVLVEQNYIKDIKYSNYWKILSLGSITVILWANIVTANDIYVKKYIEKDATIATMNRIVNDLEKIEGYISGETRVAFIGNINYLFQNPINYRRYKEITGIEHNNMAGVGYYGAVMDYILHYKINWATKEEQGYLKSLEEVKEMNFYPRNNSMKKIEDIIVIKFKE